MEHSGGTELNSGNTATPGTGRRISRRWAAIAVALAALAAAGCGGSSSSGPTAVPTASASASAIAQESSGTGSRSGVIGGALFGGNAALVQEERALGRRLAIVRDYYHFGDSFPTPSDRQAMARGSTLMVSLDTRQDNSLTYASIAAGHEDRYLSRFLRAMNHAAIRYHLPAVYFCFEHESSLPLHHTGLGSPAQFVQAWDHIHQIATRMHLDWNDGGRIHWVWIQLHNTFVPMGQRRPLARRLGAPTLYWPGRNEVDIVADDGFNNPGCPGSHSSEERPQAVFGPVLTFAQQNGGLPVFIAEWGSTAFPSSRGQAGFIGQMEAFVAANPEIAAVMYWNSAGKTPNCNFSVNAHPASVSALAAMARSAALQGRLG